MAPRRWSTSSPSGVVVADLPQAWHEIEAPGREPLDFWISGDGADRWDVFQIKDEDGVPCPVDDCEIAAEIRDDNDDLVATLAAEFTDAPTGMCRVSANATLSTALREKLSSATPRGGPCRLGTYAVYVTDSAGRWCIKAGDAFGIRK